MAPARRREWRSISGSNRWAPATAGSHDHHHHAQTFVGGVSGTRVVEADAHAGYGAHMVRDMLRRFVGSAILTVPVVLYSPLGTSLFGRELAPPLGLSPGLLGFVLTSLVVWWGGWRSR